MDVQGDTPVQEIQEVMLQMILKHGTELQDSSISEQFHAVLDDFSDAQSEQSHTDIVCTLGSAYAVNRDSKELKDISGKIFAKNYEASRS